MKIGRSPANKSWRGGPLLEAGEQIVVIERPSRLLVLPKYLLTLGMYSLWRKRDVSAVTNRRLLLGRGVLQRAERSIPLERVDDVTFTRRGFAAYADVIVGGRRGAEVVRIGPLSAQRARSVAARIGRRLL